MRTLPRLLLLGAVTTSVACADALPTESLPTVASGAVSDILLDRHVVGTAVGDTVRVSARVRSRIGGDLDASILRWQSSDSAVAIVEDGLIIPLGPGRARILVHAPSGVSASVAVNTWGGNRVTGLSVDPDTLVIDAGRTVQPSAILSYSNGSQVRLRSSLAWRVLNSTLVSVSTRGLRGITVGETKVVASLLTLTDTAAVQVRSVAHVPPPLPSGSAAELPRVYLNTAVPAVTGRSILVGAGDDLQAAIDAARPGDELVLQAGATFVGAFTLPKKAGDAWITIRSSAAAQLPPAGTRVTPAHAALMPKLVGPRGVYTVLATAAGAHHYRLLGLEVTAKPGETQGYTLVALGEAGSKQTTLEAQPHHLVLDRVYIHGTPTLNFQRCVALNSASTAIVDSWISECHGKGFDSQAIGGWNGTGPYKIVNNHLAGAGENVMFGGADPKIPGALPRDIEFRRNHVYKPAEWKGVWSVKNSFELKLGQRILVEANVFENNWPDAQDGFGILMKSVNQGGSAPWSETSDVTFRYNVVRNMAHGVNLAGAPGSKPAVPAHHLHFAHNVFERIGDGSYRGGRMWQVSDLHRLTLEHNTSLGASHGIVFAGKPLTEFVVLNNILGRGPYTINSNAGRGDAALAVSAPDAVVRGNVMIGVNTREPHPVDNFYVATVADVGFMDFAAGDLRLDASSAFAARAPGADADAVAKATVGVDIP